MTKDYYQILGLERGASADEIKKAFHRLAHKYHPDKKGGDEARFKEVNEAYQILSDPGKRQQYDNFGSAGPNQAGGGWDFSNFAGADGQGFQFDLGDIFSDFFGGRGQGRTRRGRDISVDLQISFADSVFGTSRRVLITKIGICDGCEGKGAASGATLKTCQTCGGKGRIHENRQSVFGAIPTARECTNCGGSGQIPDKKCPNCGGRGTLRKTEEVSIVIPAGIENGEMIRLTGKGEAVARGTAGDLYVRIHVEPHRLFRRDGNNLTMNLEIRLSDALLGATYPITTLDGELKLKIPEGIGYGEVLRIKDRGVPMNNSKRGDLLVRVIIKTPARLSKKAKALVEGLRGEGV